MATFQSSKVASTVQSRDHIGLTVQYASYTFSSAPALNDVVEMVKVPSGATIFDIILSSTDMDTNGTPTITLGVGDGSSASRFISGSTVAQAGGVVYLSDDANAANAGFLYQYTADDTIDVKVTAGPATGAAGTIKLAVFYMVGQS